jgi:cytochrome b561/polyisoprenoid-binding protein YceI
MSSRNTSQSFGSITRSFHWLTALLILTAIPLGVIANRLPYDTAEALATKAQLFSIHKTIGVAAFAVALARILWALTETRPAHLHPDRRAETVLAEVVHWLLYISLVMVPLTGWVHHAAVTGFAPILWPFGQTLPFVPQTESVAAAAGMAHWVFTKVLAVSILLHVVGALKHQIVDKDSTLRRMTRGEVAPANPNQNARSALPFAVAFVLYVIGAAGAALMVPQTEAIAATPPAAQAPAQVTTGNWTVTEGSLTFGVLQMGQNVQGSFANWTAEITFDEIPVDGKNGAVVVTIDTASLTLGSVTSQAKGNDFFNTTAFPQAVFTADILPAATGYAAQGSLNLRGVDVPVTLPFSLTITDGVAVMTGETTLDRRDFKMGTAYGDESSIGFPVTVSVSLTAKRG